MLVWGSETPFAPSPFCPYLLALLLETCVWDTQRRTTCGYRHDAVVDKIRLLIQCGYRHNAVIDIWCHARNGHYIFFATSSSRCVHPDFRFRDDDDDGAGLCKAVYVYAPTVDMCLYRNFLHPAYNSTHGICILNYKVSLRCPRGVPKVSASRVNHMSSDLP